MAYDENLAGLVRTALAEAGTPGVVEKKMFGSLAFLVRGKMFINVGLTTLMCRHDPALKETLSGWPGYRPKFMKGRDMPGFCTVDPTAFQAEEDFYQWLDACLQYNEKIAG